MTSPSSLPPAHLARAERADQLYDRTIARNPWLGGDEAGDGMPPHPKQQRFLLHVATRELFYGGAGGGGKSQALWYGALQFVDVPGYAALIFRRTYADLAKPGALMDRSKAYLHGTGARWNERDKQWRFPSGAKIAFGYLEHEADKLQYKSAEYQYIAFDELTDFTESQYTFLFTRLRKKVGGPLDAVPLRMRSASNPGGPGHGWVKSRFVDAKTRDPKRVFIPATMADNPTLDQAGYAESLSNTDPLTREQIKRGNWDAVEGGRFRREWFRARYSTRGDYLMVHRPGEAAGYEVNVWQCLRFGTCDGAASARESACFTVIGAWLVTPRNDLILLDCDRFQLEIPEQVPRVQAMYDKWRLSFVGIEAVLSNVGLFQLASRTRMAVRRLNPLGKDKLVRATQAIVMAEAGRIWLPVPGLRPGMPLEDLEAELCRFTGDDKLDSTTDCVDMVSYAAKVMADGPGATSGGGVPMVLGGGR